MQTSVVAAQRIWQAFAGLVTTVLVVHFLSPEQQGWYYGLGNAAALFTLFDLGLSLILVQRSAALHTGLVLGARGEPQGENAQQFVRLTTFAYHWYRRAAALFLLVLLPCGLYFFSLADAVSAPRLWPVLWLLLLLATAVNLWLLPSMSLIEGSGEVGSIYGLRLVQGLVGTLTCWLLLFLGASVWACLGVPLMTAVLGSFWLRMRKPALLQAGNSTREFAWPRGIWQQQWRLGITWVSGVLLTQVYVLVLLRFDGPVAAGQMGLALAIANMLAIVSQSLLTSAYPRMALSAAQKKWSVMRAAFRRAVIISVVFYVAGALVFSALLTLPILAPYQARLLPQPALLILFGAIFSNQLCAALAAYVRAAGREPFVWVSVMSALLTFAGAFAVVGAHGVEGLVLIMLGVQLLFALPVCIWLWFSERKNLESAK